MRVLFAADTHLAAAFGKAAARFFDFLRNDARGADALYLLGDIFHLWLGDDIGDGDSDIGEQTAGELAALADSGVAVYFQRGNHDFLVGDKFAARAKIKQILPDEAPLVVGKRRLLLMHGDTLCALDEDYQRFRAQVRHPQTIAAFLSLPPNARREQAKALMRETKAAKSVKKADLMAIPQEVAAAALSRHDCDTLIHGHTHQPEKIPMPHPARERVVLPDWPLHCSGGYAEYDGIEVRLRVFAKA